MPKQQNYKPRDKSRERIALVIDSEVVKMAKRYSLQNHKKFANFVEEAILSSIPQSFYETYKRKYRR